MTGDRFAKIRVVRRGGVATVTIDNPPVNVLDLDLMREVRAFLASVRHDVRCKVVVFESANPEFFIAHVDMELGKQAGLLGEFARSALKGLNPFQALSEELRRARPVTIVKLAGLARGGGAEFVAAADMAFAGQDRGALAQCEVLMGITPGGGGTQYLPQRMTRGRALEIVLGASLFDARTAERYGWINRSLPDEALDGFVDTLANDIASLADGVVEAAKQAIRPNRSLRSFWREQKAWFGLVRRPASKRLMDAALRAGAQTREVELHLERALRPLQPNCRSPSEPTVPKPTLPKGA